MTAGSLLMARVGPTLATVTERVLDAYVPSSSVAVALMVGAPALVYVWLTEEGLPLTV